MVNRKIIEIIKEYLLELSSKGLDIKKAILYGSRARGNALEDSDIDLLLISPQFDVDIDKYIPTIWISAFRADNRIEPIAVGEKRYAEDDISPLLEISRKEGIVISIN